MAKKKPSLRRDEAEVYALHVEKLIRERGDYRHISVRPYGSHLIVESREDQEPWPIARLSYLGGNDFGLAFRRHTGQWEPMPFWGPLEAVTGDLLNTLAPYLARTEIPSEISGTSH